MLRAWLYRIATNVCLDTIRRRSRRVPALGSVAEIPWLQPYPDQLLDELAPSDDQPDAVAVERETIELTFLAAMQVLPPRQRAALILRDVLGHAGVGNGLVARHERCGGEQHAPAGARHDAGTHARATLGVGSLKAECRGAAAPRPLHQRARALRCPAAVAIAAQEIRVTMPPDMLRFDGLDMVGALIARAFGPERDGDWRLVPTLANRMPTAASYLRRPGDSEFRAFKFDVLRIEAGKIVEITTFGAKLFPAFGLPITL